MKIQSFKNYIGKTHEVAMSGVLGIPINNYEKKGIDLIDSDKGVEVKGCLIYPESTDYKKNYVKWTLFDRELHWHEKYCGLPLYCALGTYELGVPREKLGFGDMNNLELFVARREVWIVPWDWTLNFPIKEGKHHNYRYLRPRPVASSGIPAMPEIEFTKKIHGGLLHLTEGVKREHFKEL